MKEEVDNKVDKNEFFERNRNKTREKNLEQVYSFYATLNFSGARFLKISGSFALNISARAH